MNQPTIIIQFKCQETLKSLPDIYVRSFADAIKANAQDFESLEGIRRELINLRSWVDHYQSELWAKKQGFVGSAKITKFNMQAED